MKVTVDKTTPSERVLTVELEAAVVERSFQEAFKESRKQLKLKGFRKGHVPESVARTYLTDSILVKRVINALVPPAYKDAIKLEQLQPLGKPDWTLKQSERGRSLIFEAKVQVLPILDLDYQDLVVERDDWVIADEKIESVLESLQQRASVFQEHPPDYEAKLGDFCFLDYKACHNGQDLPHSNVSNFLLELKPERFLPGFVDQLIGVRAGQQRTFSLRLPENYSYLDLASELVEFRVSVHHIKQRLVPPLDDQFAVQHGGTESIALLRENIRKNLTEQALSRHAEDVVNEVIKRLANHIDPSQVPYQLQEGHAKLALRTQTQALERQGVSMENYLQSRGISTAHFGEELKLTGLVEARLEILYRSIAAKENIVVMNKEVDQAIIAQAKAKGQDAKEIKLQMIKDDTYKLLAYRILIAKVRKLLLANTKVQRPSTVSTLPATGAPKKASKPKAKVTEKKRTPAALDEVKVKSKSRVKAKAASRANSKPQEPVKAKSKSKSKSKTKVKAKKA